MLTFIARLPVEPRSKRNQQANDAADQQPWRCVACGEAVSHIRRNDCACIRALRTEEPKP